MYFPILRTLQNEVRAIHRLSATLIASHNVVPVFEPVNESQIGNMRRVADAGLEILVIANPDRGPYEGSALPPSYAALLALANVIPTLLVDAGTSNTAITNFRSGETIAILVQDTPMVSAAAAISSRAPKYVLFAEGIVPGGIAPRARAVHIEDPFHRRQPNAAYAGFPDETYSNRYHTVAADPDFAHFGDHSIQGDTLGSTGGQGAIHAALHHIYITGQQGNDLNVRHYVSTVHAGVRTEVPLKFLDALAQLCGDLPRLRGINSINHTVACDEYLTRHASGYASNLGYAKQLAIRHHIELMSQLT